MSTAWAGDLVSCTMSKREVSTLLEEVVLQYYKKFPPTTQTWVEGGVTHTHTVFEKISIVEVTCWGWVCNSMHSPSMEEDYFYATIYETIKRLYREGWIPGFVDDHEEFHAACASDQTQFAEHQPRCAYILRNRVVLK